MAGRVPAHAIRGLVGGADARPGLRVGSRDGAEEANRVARDCVRGRPRWPVRIRSSGSLISSGTTLHRIAAELLAESATCDAERRDRHPEITRPRRQGGARPAAHLLARVRERRDPRSRGAACRSRHRGRAERGLAGNGRCVGVGPRGRSQSPAQRRSRTPVRSAEPRDPGRENRARRARMGEGGCALRRGGSRASVMGRRDPRAAHGPLHLPVARRGDDAMAGDVSPGQLRRRARRSAHGQAGEDARPPARRAR